MTPQPQFAVMLYPDQPMPVLAERIQWVESLGFDQIFLPDHSADLRNRRGMWFDSWSVLTLAALTTRRIRIGTLVANQILRPPSQLAKQAITIDHLSHGRLELGIGTGLFDWDHHSVGNDPWSPRQRVQRFIDYVAIVDGILRSGAENFNYVGSQLWAKDIVAAPGSFQSPRPPIIIGGQSPTLLRVAAERADVWNTHGPPGASAQEILSITAEQNRRLDQLAIAAGRDPARIRRSYTIFGPWDPTRTDFTFDDVFRRFGKIGVTDFVLDWPRAAHVHEFERIARDVLPVLRGI